CRLKYDSKNGEAYYLNAKDSMTLGFIPELVDAGINSFKIEGRMKNKYYAAYMAHLYKHYTDVYIEKGREHFCELKRDPESELNKDIKNALDIYNRGGSFPAFLFAGQSDETIEKSIKGHRGVPVGKVVSVNKSKNNSKAEIVLTEKVNPKDVLDIIRNGEKIYEFTAANASKKGERISANIGYCDVKSNDEVYRVRNNHLLEKIDDMINDASEASRIPAEISVRAKAGELLEMTFTAKEMSVTVSGSEVQKATSKPVTKEDVIKAIGKLNDTGFVPERVELVSDGDCFFPMKEVKELRRNVLDKWEEEFTKKYIALQRSSQNADYSGLTDIVKQYDDKKLNYNDAENRNGFESDNCFEHDDIISSVGITAGNEKKFVSILSLEQLKSVTKNTNKNDILIVRLEGFSEEEIKEYIKIRKSSDKTFAFSLPRPLHGEILEKVETLVGRILADYGDDSFGDIFVANSLASIAFRNRFFSSTPMYADVNLYMENDLAKDVFAGLGIVGVVALDAKQVPVMTTKHRIDATMITTPKRDAFSVVHHGEYG
ncbi:MAG: DUF3656 domain-containing protein, partial [Clostridia bacterium]|nr:DUF3656 domain-containing protein [Clostridia bacterium]